MEKQNKFYVFTKQKGMPRKMSDALTFENKEELLTFLEAYDIDDSKQEIYIGIKSSTKDGSYNFLTLKNSEKIHKELFRFLSKSTKKYKFTYLYGNSIKAYK